MRWLGFKEAPGSWGVSQGGEGWLGSMNRPTGIGDVWKFGIVLRFSFLSRSLSHNDRRRRAVFACLVNVEEENWVRSFVACVESCARACLILEDSSK